MEITQRSKKKEFKKKKQNIRDLWEIIRHSNIHITEVIKREDGGKGA